MKNVSFTKVLNKNNKRNIVLIGHMGSGKSILAKKIAYNFKIEHIDTDREISKFEDNTINNIFATKGEDYFRSIECKIVLESLKRRNVVISLGGGSILKKEVRNEINKQSFSVFLDVDINILNNRLKKSKNRPLLKDRNILTTLKELDKQRRKYYLNADIKIDTASSSEITLLTFKKIFLSTYD